MSGADEIVPTLHVIRGPDQGKAFPLDADSLTIGRSQDCEICLGDDEVSRNHARIVRRDEIHEIEDLNSTNGVKVNGRFVKRRPLRDGDHLIIGLTGLTYQVTSLEPLELDAVAGGKKTITMTPETMFRDWETEAQASGGRARADLEALYEVGNTINSLLDSAQLFPRILDVLLSVIPQIERCSIYIQNEETGNLEPMAKRTREKVEPAGDVISMTMADQAIKERVGLLTHDASQDTRFMSGMSVVEQQIRSAICVPLHTQDKSLGVIYADALSAHEPCSREDLRLVTAIGMHAASALENARLYTSLFETHELLKQAQDSLIQSEKMAAVGQLVAGIVHDIKNPLGVVMGYVELLEARLRREFPEVASAPRIEEVMVQLKEGVDHSQGVVQRMLKFAKPSEKREESIDINALLAATLQFLLHETSKARVTVEATYADDLPAVVVDSDEIKQVFLNMILNAVQAKNGERGVLQVRTEVRGVEENRFVTVAFEDDGCGMTEEQKRKVFDPFFTTKKAGAPGGGGTGLGLSMCYSIVQNHGGWIEVETAKDVGTTFTVLLPAALPVEG